MAMLQGRRKILKSGVQVCSNVLDTLCPLFKIGLPDLPKLGRGRGASPLCPFSAYGPVLTFVSSVCMTLDG